MFILLVEETRLSSDNTIGKLYKISGVTKPDIVAEILIFYQLKSFSIESKAKLKSLYYFSCK